MLKKILLTTGAIGAAIIGAKAFKKMHKMPLIGDLAPFFSANSTKGKINFPCDYRGKWVVFFSHPADFTPVCTTEIMYFEKYYDEFKKLNTELLGLSVDSYESHMNWISSIKDKIKFKGLENLDITFPIIDDENGEIASKYGMLQNNPKAVRAVFVVDPKALVRAVIYYPFTTGRNLDEILRLVNALQVSDEFGVSTPANWQKGDDVIVPAPKETSEQNEKIICQDWYLCTKELSQDEIDKKFQDKQC